MGDSILGMSRSRAAFLGAGVLLLAVLVWILSPGMPRSSAANRELASAIAVDSATATRSDVPVHLGGLGTVQAYFTVKVTARVDGQLERVAFAEGQTLKKGALLAQIDPRPFQAALDQALATRAKDEAQLGNARQDLGRYEMLAPQDLASKQTVDTAHALVAQLQAQIKADEAAVENARTQLSYTTITSPIDGRTGIRLVDPGNIVHATDTTGIVTMTQVQPIAVMITVPENAIGALAEAMAAGPVSVVALSSDGHAELDQGRVALIDNQIDQTTGTVRLKAIFPNARERLWPGQFVGVRVLVSTAHDALTIPATALQRGPNGIFAYVIGADSTVDVRLLQVSNESEERAIVNGGLKDGERVATSNLYRLQPGARVRSAAAQEDVAARRAPAAAPATPSAPQKRTAS
jgi:multidrug efflux system membrane fusion protein